MVIWLAYAAFALLALLAFAAMEARTAAVTLYFGGWLLLPVAIYPPHTLTAAFFTVEVIGVGLPSNLGLTKGVIVPLATCAAWLVMRMRRVASDELTLFDAAMAGFCLWPIAGALIRGSDMAMGGRDALYLCGSWGATWTLARGLFRRPEDWIVLLRAAAWSGVALAPIALIEGAFGPWVYDAVWGEHAFLREGADRPIGFRPLGFFEHGNQYALWLALAAFAWVALARLGALQPWQRWLALGTIAAVIAAQSIGAALLAAVGIAAVLMPPAWLRRGVVVGGGIIALFGTVYLSGVIPAERIRQSAAMAPANVARFDPIRLRSLLYRIRRDQMAVPLLQRAPLAGTGQWDWWRPLGSHPWGLPLLIAGQFGAVAVLLLLAALLVPAATALFRDDRRGVVCGILVLVAAADALFNSFVYFPAVLFAGALVSVGAPRHTKQTDSRR